MIRFINREDELRILKEDYSRENAFIVVYGRRRIGKTRLIEEFLKDQSGVKYTAEDINKKIQIKEFKSILSNYLKDEFLQKQDIEEWPVLFSYLTRILENKKMYLWIDEFSYLIKNDPSLTSVLQKFIDSFLRRSNIFFIVSGSLFGLMSEKVLSSSSPLYGRRTRSLLIAPLKQEHIDKFLKMDFEDSFKTGLSIGGIPEYLIVASPYPTYEKYIENEFLKREGYFYREPYFLLSREFKEIKRYFSILNAIAYGNTKPSNIANFVGMDAREIYPYLDLLINYGFINRETSILGDKKRGIYLIKDSFFDFWFNIVHRNREDIEKDNSKLNSNEVASFLGKRFQIFVDNRFNLFFNQKEFPKYGRWWYKDKEIDVLALNEKTKEVLLCECKWQEKVDAEKIIQGLKEKTEYIPWNNENRKESFAVFAKSFKKKVKEFEGKKVHCFDLKDIEKILKRS